MPWMKRRIKLEGLEKSQSIGKLQNFENVQLMMEQAESFLLTMAEARRIKEMADAGTLSDIDDESDFGGDGLPAISSSSDDDSHPDL